MSDPLKPVGDDEAPAATVFTWIVAIVWVLVGGLATRSIPVFEEIFKDFDTKLPWVTGLILRVPEYAWLAGGILAAGLLLLKARVVPRPTNWLLDLIALGLCLACVALLVVAMFEPLLALIQNLSK